MKKIIPIVLASFLSAFFAVFIYAQFFANKTVVYEQNMPSKYTSFAEGSPLEKYVVASPSDFTEAAAKVTSSVVHIKSLTKSYDWWGGANYASSSGSGVLVANDGYIVTNNHVIEDASELEVTMNDKRTFTAKLIGTDPTTDLALIKIESNDMPYIKFADSDKSRVGEWVLAIGNPFSLTSTVTAGIISAKGRNIEILEDNYAIESFIQTDAAVNPGNSGGALVNTNGDLVGINTAIITKSGRYEGYSFAVPSNLVSKVILDLKEFGKVQRGLLNVSIDDVNETMKEQLGLSSLAGVYIRMVNPEGAAHDAGIKEGDVVVGISGKKIKSIPELQEILGVYRPGDVISLEYIRNGKKQKTDVTLKDRYNSTSLNRTAAKPNKELIDLGVELRNLTIDESSKMRTKGVKVISITRNSKIDGTNMEPGYVITKLNDREVASINELAVVYKDLETGTKIMFEGFYEEYPDEYFYAFRK
jgi:serine protease Do